MRSMIHTWEDALTEAIFKKALLCGLHATPQGKGRRHQPDTAPDAINPAKRAKPAEQYTMLVETDVVSSVHGILP